MKKNHKRFLALCLSASMLVSPLSYIKAYASEEAGVTESGSQNAAVAEIEDKSENQSPSLEENGNASGQENETPSKDNGSTADTEKTGSAVSGQSGQQAAEAGQIQSEATSSDAVTQEENAPTVTGNTVQVVKSDGTVFTMFKITSSTVKKNGEQYDVTFITSNANYDKIYLGSKDDESKEPVIKRSTDGTNTFTFKVDASKVGKVQPVVLGTPEGSWYTKQDLWIYIPEETVTDPGTNPTPEPEPTPTPEPTPATPEDGSYNNIGVTSSASMFKVVDCKLVVKDGKLTAILTLSGTGYGYLYKGTAEGAAAADKNTWIPFVEDANGKYTYGLPLDSLAENKVKIAAFSTKYSKWYDRELTFDFSNMDRIYPTAADGTYTIDVDSSASMFKVVNCKLTVKNGLMTAVLTLSGTGYDYLYVGTGAEAENADSKSWVPFVVNANGGYDYTIPVTALDKKIAVAAHSIKKDQWYDRELTFKYDTLQKINDGGSTDPSTPTTPTKPSDNNGNSNTSKPNDGKADNESKWEADTSGSTSAVNSSTTLADGVYTPDRFSWSGGTGKVKITCNKVTIKNGQAYATLVFDSDHYQYVKANGKTYYTTKGGGNATVVIPIALNQNNTILGMTDKMSVAHEIAYTIFVYLAAAGDGKGAGTVQNKTLDDEAPEIMGLNYESETKLEHAEYFKIYHYDKGITLLEVDVTKDTVRDPENTEDSDKDSDKKNADTKNSSSKTESASEEQTDNNSEEAAGSAEDGEAVSEAEQAAELYKGNVIKYLLVPENTVIPIGLSEDMIVVQMPVDKAYVSDNAILKQMEEMNLLDQVAAVGMKKKNCEVSDIADKMTKKKDEKQAEVIYGGKETDPEFRDLVKQEVNLSLVSSNLLPAEDKTTKKDKTITEEEQKEQWEKITEKYALLGIPMIVDRSADEKDELAKAEWIKVYGVIFGCEDQANDLYDNAVK